jgi:hypothetical protein
MAAVYTALVSSDWNECLAPCGPFDVFAHHYPALRPDLDTIFRQYTGNLIPLQVAVRKISQLLPGPLSGAQMDAYLAHDFQTYRGVTDLMRRCAAHGILFMLNTTGMTGYFQQALARGLLPPLTVLSAHPLIRFESRPSDPPWCLELRDTTDKAKNTAAVAARYAIAPERVILIGDSGGDGPHFAWGAKVGACLIGSMTKPSLAQYCRQQGIVIQHYFGHTYADGETRALEKEMPYDFNALFDIMQKAAQTARAH